MNGVGGKVDAGEDYLNTCIREIQEETGYIITPAQIQLSGVVKLEGGYKEDWVICFFKVEVDSYTIPTGNNTEDGEFVWINQDEVLDKKYDLVDDIRYVFNDIAKGEKIFFMNAQLDDQQKIVHTSISYLK